MRNWLFIIIGFFLALLPLRAQEDNTLQRQIYAQAEAQYQLGQLDQAAQLLEQNLPSFKGPMKQNAYRLLSLCYMAMDNDDEVKKNAQLLLNENPYYTSVQDPPRFEDMINDLKAGRVATITTASKQAESMEEAPVPVTLITEDMIRMSTARNLQELLADYVPGVNIVEGEETNVAMRGVYSALQENVLIMLNGVRLNSYCTNASAPDFRISLANIRQIEVLRGAASSLYGNVALSAVVNIITKSGSQVDGLQATVGAGNTNTLKADLIWGKHLVDTDLLLWGSIYNSKGTRHNIKADDPHDAYGIIPVDGSIYTNGFNHMPSFDIGLSFKWDKFNLQVNHQYGKRCYVYNNMYITSLYDYDKYKPINGMKPGKGVQSTNATLRYANTWKKWSIDAGVTYNSESTSLYNIFGDTIPAQQGYLLMMIDWNSDEFVSIDSTLTSGVFLTQSWKNTNLGADFRAIYEYDTGKWGSGNLLIGIQYDFFDLNYNDLSAGDKFGRIAITTINERSKVFKNDHEQSQSMFMQLKHRFWQNVIVNSGFRLDRRKRYTGRTLRQLSPRVALIWSPSKNMNYKLSYARSFEDAPYFYRASSILYPGNEDLNPQFMDNYQMSAILSFPSIHTRFESCLFYNHVQDIITLGLNKYFNQGTIKTLGWENIIEYQHQGFKARATTYFHHVLNQRLFDKENDTGEGYTIYSIPDFTAHLQLEKEVTKNFHLITKASFNGRNQFFYSSAFAMKPYQDVTLTNTRETLPSCFLLDMGARYSWNNWAVSLDCRNMLNHTYRIGGDRVPVLQEKRILLGTLTLKL